MAHDGTRQQESAGGSDQSPSPTDGAPLRSTLEQIGSTNGLEQGLARHGGASQSRDARTPADAPDAVVLRDQGADDQIADLRERAQLLDLAHDIVFVHDMKGRVTFWNAAAERILGWNKQEIVGKPSRATLHTELPAPLAEVSKTLADRGRWEGELVHTARDGRRVPVDSRWVLMLNEQGQPKAVLEIDRDITERREAEWRAQSERDRLFTVLNMLPGYAVLRDRAFNIRFANHGFLDAFPDPNSRHYYQTRHGPADETDDWLIRRVLDERETLDWECTYPNGTTYHVWAFPFRDSDGTDLLLEFGVDVTQRRKLEHLVSRMSEAERRKIGRELHDTVGQTMTGLGYLIGGLADRTAKQLPEERETTQKITRAINDAIAQTRALAQGLDPVGLAEDGLQASLRQLASTIEATMNIDCQYSGDADVKVDQWAGTQLYRIAQEAANNAAKHSGGDRIRVSLRQNGDRVALRVADNGVGVERNASDSGGMGLRIMRYRANTIGAALRIEALPDGGTVATCTLPIPEHNQA